MICEICHKQEAIVVYNLVVNNRKTVLHLCESCATKKGLINSLERKKIISLSSSKSDIDKLKCPKCELTYNEYIESHKLGCPTCYEAFDKEITSIIYKIHGNTRHIGKVVKGSKEEKEFKILKLKEELNKAIKEELFERAAQIRDELKKIQNKHK